MHLRQRGPHAHTQLGVEVGQRFVHEEHLRLAHDRPAHRHTLALAAGQSRRLALQVLLQAKDTGRVAHTAVDLRLGCLAHPQAERQVLSHGHAGVKGIVLENHGDVAVLGRHVVHDKVADPDSPTCDRFQPGYQTQDGGLPAPGRTDQDHKLAVRDVQAQAVHRFRAVGICLVDSVQHDLSHADQPFTAEPIFGAMKYRWNARNNTTAGTASTNAPARIVPNGFATVDCTVFM